MSQACGSDQKIQAWQEYGYWRVNRPRCYFKCTGGKINQLWAAALRGHNRMYPYYSSLEEEETDGDGRWASPARLVGRIKYGLSGSEI